MVDEVRRDAAIESVPRQPDHLAGVDRSTERSRGTAPPPRMAPSGGVAETTASRRVEYTRWGRLDTIPGHGGDGRRCVLRGGDDLSCVECSVSCWHRFYGRRTLVRSVGTEPSRPITWTSPDGFTWMIECRAGLRGARPMSQPEAGLWQSAPRPERFDPPVQAQIRSLPHVDVHKVAGATGPPGRVDRARAPSVTSTATSSRSGPQVWQTDDGVTWRRMTGTLR
jgi:hypothetical protein